MQITCRYFQTTAAISSAARLFSEDNSGIIRFITFSSSRRFSQPTHQQFTSSVTITIYFSFFCLFISSLNNFAIFFVSYLYNTYYCSALLPLSDHHHKPWRKTSPGLWNTTWKHKVSPGVGGSWGTAKCPKIPASSRLSPQLWYAPKLTRKYLWKWTYHIHRWWNERQFFYLAGGDVL